MKEIIETLEGERQFAETQAQEERLSDPYEFGYWVGYAEATANAQAIIYGPTPLEREEN